MRGIGCILLGTLACLSKRCYGVHSEYDTGQRLLSNLHDETGTMGLSWLGDVLKQFAGKPALVFSDETVSYGELDERSNQFANALLLSGKRLKENDLVGCYFPREADFFACVIGVLKAGLGYVPMEKPSVDLSEALRRMNHVEAVAIFTDHEDASEFGSRRVASPNRTTSTTPPANPVRSTPSSIAYNIPRSGTVSGLSNHTNSASIHNVNFFVNAWSEWLNAHPPLHGKWLQFAGFEFDILVMDFLCCLKLGKTLYVATEEHREDLAALAAYIDKEGIETAFIPPVHLSELSAIGVSLKRVITGGDAASERSFRDLQNNNCQIVHVYGLNECTVFSTAHIVSDPQDRNNVGKPLPGVKVQVFDEERNSVGAGEIGEIHISSPGITLDAEDNRAHFKVIAGLPFWETGDLGMMNSDGELIFKGRKALQGEPRTIDTMLENEMGEEIKQIASVGRNLFIVGFGKLEKSKVMDMIRNHLPEESDNVCVKIVDEIPKARSNAKVDVSRLDCTAA